MKVILGTSLFIVRVTLELLWGHFETILVRGCDFGITLGSLYGPFLHLAVSLGARWRSFRGGITRTFDIVHNGN